MDSVGKVELLRKRADELEVALRKYAEIDSYAAMALCRILPIFHKINAGEIVPPCGAEYGHYDFSTEGVLFKYSDLCAAEAKFAAALGDWYSQLWFKSIADR